MTACVTCGVMLKLNKMGVTCIKYIGDDPISIQFGDVYECPKCGLLIVTHCGTVWKYSYESDFDNTVKKIMNSGNFVEIHEA